MFINNNSNKLLISVLKSISFSSRLVQESDGQFCGLNNQNLEKFLDRTPNKLKSYDNANLISFMKATSGELDPRSQHQLGQNKPLEPEGKFEA